MAQDTLKTSTRSILALVQAKKFRNAAQELRKLEPMRKKIYGYDRLVAAVHSPLTKAEKLFFEAQSLVPETADGKEGDAATRGSRTRGAIRRLMKARTIVRDDPGINALLKQCLATLQEAENKVSAAQGMAMRGDYAAAYKEIREAAQLDDSSEVKETRKLIAEQYRAQTTEAENVKRAWFVAKIGVAALAAILVAVLVTRCVWRDNVDAVRREEEAKKRKLLVGAGTAVPPPPAVALPAAPVSSAPGRPSAPAPSLAPAPLPPTPAVSASPESAPAPVAEKAAEKDLEIQADAPMGTRLGLLPPGTKITLRYKAGKWMPWRNRTSFSPDAPSEAGKRHCLAIRGLKADGTWKLLQVVPFHTKDAPSTYEIIGRYEDLALAINDDDGNFDNNDGVVTYGILVVKP